MSLARVASSVPGGRSGLHGRQWSGLLLYERQPDGEISSFQGTQHLQTFSYLHRSYQFVLFTAWSPLRHDILGRNRSRRGARGADGCVPFGPRRPRTLLLEKRPSPGNKILLSGGTRCNLTHAADRRGIVEAFGSQGPFLHSALAALGPEQVIELFEAEGVPTKVEPGGKVFPLSDRAADVLAALLARLKRTDCTLALDEPLLELRRKGDEFLLVTMRRSLSARKVVLATGGQSYPASGSTGDGYRWAAELGHTIVSPRPALVPITTHAADVLALQGITIPDVRASVLDPSGSEKMGIDALQQTDLGVCKCRLGANAHFLPAQCLQQRRAAVRTFRRDWSRSIGCQQGGERLRQAAIPYAAIRFPARDDATCLGGCVAAGVPGGGQAACRRGARRTPAPAASRPDRPAGDDFASSGAGQS